MSLRSQKGKTVMARTKTSVINREDDKKKKEVKKTDEAKKTGKDTNSSDGSKQDSSESEDEMFSKMDKRDSGIPKFIKGTTWPLDTSVEVTVNYDAAKEIRSVKKEFYPLLYHMTRADPRQMSNNICRSKVLLSYVKARVEQDERSKDRNRTRHLISQKEISDSKKGSLGVEERPDSPMKLRKTFTSAAVASSITDLTDAKTEVLKLLTRASLKRQDFAKLLVWIQKLKLCGKEGHGRWGEVYVKDTTLDSTDSYRYNSSDSDGEVEPSKSDGGRVKQVRRGGVMKGRGGRKVTNKRNRSTHSGDKRNSPNVRNWKVALRQNTPQRGSQSPELVQEQKVQKKMCQTPEQVQYTSLIKSSSVSLAGSKKALSSPPLSSPPASSKTWKFSTYELKGKTLCKKESEKKKSIDKKKDSISPCSIPIVDVMSVLDKKEISVLDNRIKDKHKPQESKSQNSGRGQSRRRHLSHKEGKSVKSRTSDEEDEDELIPHKKHRQSADPEVPIPVCLYRADENENLSSPVVEIDNVENGVCVPYEDRFVQKAEEEQRLLKESLQTAALNVNIIPGHLSTSALGIQLNMPKFGMPLGASNIQSGKVPITSAGIPQFNAGQLSPLFPPSNIAQGTSCLRSPPPPYTISNSVRHVPPPQYNRVPISSSYNSITSTLPPQNVTLINTSSSTVTSDSSGVEQLEQNLGSSTPATDITTMINSYTPNNSQLTDTTTYPNVPESMPAQSNIPRTQLNEPTSQNTQERVRVKQENNSGFSEKNIITSGLSINDGITMNFSQRTMPPLGDSSFGQHEPSSSTNDNDNDKNSVKQEASMDYVVVKNEETVFISLDSDDDDENAARNISNNAKKNTTNIDDQKEADPIIVIDD
ncbi:uncharacterized protein LOC134687412 isoform X2 [Mytilus trossulus]|uniref:uncharacterized protein LOC134687412 isoform X2 n=2 Tax=Mytilus trossulus TaxID=6551 RepID=UPI003007DCB7